LARQGRRAILASFEGEGAMSDIPGIDDGGEEGSVDILPPEGVVAAAVATGAAVACLSCAAKIVGPYCANCGQKNDDMRRSLFVLFGDFVSDTFAFDSRMWRTLGVMAIAPGAVPSSYSHGKRSRYTPPVRLFLVVSFLFFLTLGLTHTMFVAFDVEAKTAEEIAADAKAREEASRRAGSDIDKSIAEARAEAPEARGVVIDGQEIDCDIKAKMRFFVRPQDIALDEEKWRACSDSIARAAKVEIDNEDADIDEAEAKGGPSRSDVQQGFERVLAGVNMMVANPAAFNGEINTWLPRIMFFMAPVLAIIMALFIRGKDALLFDHVVLSLYSHAVAFAIIGVAILLGQFGVPYIFPAASAAFAVYFVAALKRAYGRGWIKTILSSALIGFIYLFVLTSIVGSIIANQIWRAAA
jgi:hypothetical protein